MNAPRTRTWRALAGLAATLGSAAPAHAAFVVTPDSLPSMTQYEAVLRLLPAGQRQRLFRSGEVDVNGDDQNDLVGQFTDACTAEGCETFLLMAGRDGGYSARLIGLPRVQTRITVEDTTTRGMRDLRIDDDTRRLRWNGSAYR